VHGLRAGIEGVFIVSQTNSRKEKLHNNGGLTPTTAITSSSSAFGKGDVTVAPHWGNGPGNVSGSRTSCLAGV
jgi:hypothetical protein